MDSVDISMDSVDIFHGLSGHCPWTLSPLVPILQLDNVHGKGPLSPWSFYRQDWLEILNINPRDMRIQKMCSTDCMNMQADLDLTATMKNQVF